jgi:hypothetical protein
MIFSRFYVGDMAAAVISDSQPVPPRAAMVFSRLQRGYAGRYIDLLH